MLVVAARSVGDSGDDKLPFRGQKKVHAKHCTVPLILLLPPLLQLIRRQEDAFVRFRSTSSDILQVLRHSCHLTSQSTACGEPARHSFSTKAHTPPAVEAITNAVGKQSHTRSRRPDARKINHLFSVWIFDVTSCAVGVCVSLRVNI